MNADNHASLLFMIYLYWRSDTGNNAVSRLLSFNYACFVYPFNGDISYFIY